jgi:hypothetical protein
VTFVGECFIKGSALNLKEKRSMQLKETFLAMCLGLGIVCTAQDDIHSTNDKIDEFSQALQSSDLNVRIEAIHQLSRLPLLANTPQSEQVWLLLLNHRRLQFNDYEDVFVEKALQYIAPAIIPSILKSAQSNVIGDLSNACEGMRSLGPEFYLQLVPGIETMLLSDNSDAQWCALYALEAMGQAGAEMQREVVSFLDNADFQLQIIALRALAVLGPVANETWQIIDELTENGQNVSVRSHALRTLGYVSAHDEKQAEKAATVLSENLDRFAFVVKSRALEGLIALGVNAAPAQKEVERLLRDETGLAPQAAFVYAQITQDWDVALKRFLQLLNHSILGLEVVDLLRRSGPNAQPALDALIAQLDIQAEDPETLWLIAQAIVALSPVETREDLAQVKGQPDHVFHKIACAMVELADNGQDVAKHYAQSIVAKWQTLGWVAQD